MNLITLSENQIAEKKQAEIIIGKGIGAFVEVGNALLKIQEDKLYADEFGTFEEYCKSKWGFSKMRGYQLIKAAEIAEESKPMVSIPNERIAREVGKLTKKTQRNQAAKEIAKIVKAKEFVTASKAKAIVEKIQTSAKGGIFAEMQRAKENVKPVIVAHPETAPKKLFETPSGEAVFLNVDEKKWVRDEIQSYYDQNKTMMNSGLATTIIIDRIKSIFA